LAINDISNKSEEVWDILFYRLFTNFAKKEHGKREHYYGGYRGF
jgi:hypothetical protein